MTLDNLPTPAVDTFSALMQCFNADTRTDKVDLGIGVYFNEAGKVPVMQAVRRAEAQILSATLNKTYPLMTGDTEYCQQVCELLLGSLGPERCVATAQTLGGSGALRVLVNMFSQLPGDGRSIWMPDPTWPNHAPLTQCDLSPKGYHFIDDTSGLFSASRFIDGLAQAQTGDVVLIHGGCHNPTGIDPNDDDLLRIAAFMRQRGLFPLIDLAYLGFGAGLPKDIISLQIIARHVPQIAIAFSCSKTFGIYGDRLGAALVTTGSDAVSSKVLNQMIGSIRRNYSMPPKHGARIISLILNDPELRHDWEIELESFRRRIDALRSKFAAQLDPITHATLAKSISSGRGMFCSVGLNDQSVTNIRVQHGIYLGPGGRMNISGLTQSTVVKVAKVVSQVLNDQANNRQSDETETHKN